MKYLIFLLTLVPFALCAQDCNLKKGTDAITSKPTLSTGFIELPGATLSIDVNSKEIDFFFVMSLPAAKCLDENTTVSFMFEGGKLKSEFKNFGSMNCDGIFHVIFRNSAYTSSPLQKLGAKKILTIRLTGSSPKPIDINLNAEQQQRLMGLINCIVKESKSVL